MNQRLKRIVTNPGAGASPPPVALGQNGPIRRFLGASWGQESLQCHSLVPVRWHRHKPGLEQGLLEPLLCFPGEEFGLFITAWRWRKPLGWE